MRYYVATATTARLNPNGLVLPWLHGERARPVRADPQASGDCGRTEVCTSTGPSTSSLTWTTWTPRSDCSPRTSTLRVKPKPLPPRHAAFQGEMTRIILGVLRETGLTLTTRDLAFADHGGRDSHQRAGTWCDTERLAALRAHDTPVTFTRSRRGILDRVPNSEIPPRKG